MANFPSTTAIEQQSSPAAEGGAVACLEPAISIAAAPARLKHIPALDGLRGVAIILVCFYHFWHLPMAWAGVDLFFALSGFLITRILIRQRIEPHYFRNFYVHRALRILPMYYLFVAAFFFPVLSFARRHGIWLDAPSQAWYWFHLSNWSSAFGPMIISPIGHFWSLAIEEQFYLVWPFLVLLLSVRQLRRLCIGIIVFASVARCAAWASDLWKTYPEMVYRLTPFRVDPLAFGAILATVNRRLNPWIFLALGSLFLGPVVFFTHAYQTPQMFTFGFTGVALLCFAAVLAAIQYEPKFLSHPILKSFGKYSYSMYLVQVPVYFLLAWVLDHAGIYNFYARSFWFSLIGFPTTYGFAWVTWRAIEAPFLSLKRYF